MKTTPDPFSSPYGEVKTAFNGGSNYAGTGADEGSDWSFDNSGTDYANFRLGFQGMRWDDAAGGQYLSQTRRYLPSLGTWNGRDPLGTAYQDGMNLYGFVENNPVNQLDFTGLDATNSFPIYSAGLIVGVGGTVSLKAEIKTTDCCLNGKLIKDGHKKISLKGEAWVGMGAGGKASLPWLGEIGITYKAFGIKRDISVGLESPACGNAVLTKLVADESLTGGIDNSASIKGFSKFAGFEAHSSAGITAKFHAEYDLNTAKGSWVLTGSANAEFAGSFNFFGFYGAKVFGAATSGEKTLASGSF